MPAVLSPWPVVAAIITLLLFLASYNKKTLLISIVVTVLAAAAAVLAVRFSDAFQSGETIDSNPLLFWIIVISTSCIVYWSSRTRAGLILLFLAGTLMSAAFALLEYPVSLWGYLTFFLCASILFLYRVYVISLLRTDTGKISFRAYFIQSLLVGCLVATLACGVYYGVIRPLSPPTNEIHLATKLMSLEVLEKIGVSSRTEIPGEDLQSETLEEDTKTAQSEQNDANTTPETQDRNEGTQNTFAGNDAIQEAFAVIYEKSLNWLPYITAVVILLIAAPILLKLWGRRRWYRKLLKEPNEDGIIKLYGKMTRNIRKAGIRRPKDATLLEFAQNSEKRLEKFSVEEADFTSLTHIYMRIIYGYQPVSREEAALFHTFYGRFYKNLRREMGAFRYCMHFLAI